MLFLAVAAGVMFWMRPLTIHAWFQQRHMSRAGLQRVLVDTSVGRQAVWQGGSGSTLMLLHGAGDHAATWSIVVPDLISAYRLIVPDLPGHGGSAPATGSLSMGTILNGVGELLEKLAPDKPVILVGNSLGGWIGMLLALEKPGKCARLVIVNGGGLKGERADLTLTPENRDQARKLIAALRDPGSAFIPDFVVDDMIRRAREGAIGRMAAAAGDMEKNLLDDRLQDLKVPVDFLWGESDKLLGVDYARRMVAQIPAARLTLIPGCGHVPQQECPEQFSEGLLKILRQGPPAARGQ
jgi:3-oxoadipate enol-lactonase